MDQPTSRRAPRTDSWTGRGHFVLVVLLVALLGLSTSVLGTTPARGASATLYPDGVADTSEPSGMSPPGPDDLPGYTESYVNDFLGNHVPAGWDVFSGIPGGDPGGHFGAKHVVVANGLLQLNTWRDKNFHHGRFVTGGLCQCGLARVYGAYFVRSRITGPGPNEVTLLWPVSNNWPPEIDINETGASDTGTTLTVHWGSANSMYHGSIKINMKRWHTWGVIWSAHAIEFTVDGRLWNVMTVKSEIPKVPMDLNMEQRAECQLGRECPTKNVSMLVDWVAEYVPTPVPATTGSTSTTTTTP